MYRFSAAPRLIRSPFKFTRNHSYYITTPIFYVNAPPHIGHVHTLLLADSINRFESLRSKSCDGIFSTGTDEHGIKIQTAAAKAGIDCQNFCDMNAMKFISLFDRYDTTLTRFIRTSEERHVKAVQMMWSALEDQGYIYKSSYSGWYCTSDEVFVPESQVTREVFDGSEVFKNQDGQSVVWCSEENYLFRMSLLGSQVLEWLENEQPVIPKKFNDDAIATLKQSSMSDISISRPKKRLTWGIEVPGDPSQTIYVWLDALANYLTVVGYPNKTKNLDRWPIDCQVFGKDIIRFHAILWPAFLMALSLPLPRKLVCHSHWLFDSLKMSKSRGNVVDPLDENDILTAEGLRYYLLRSSTPHSDSDYSRTQAIRRVNAELADTFGNLLSRSCSMVINPNQVIPTKLVDSHISLDMQSIIDVLRRIQSDCENHYDAANFYLGVDCIMSLLRLNNALYEHSQPWRLVKELASREQARRTYLNVQALTFETLRICSILLQPIVPKLANLALNRLNITNRWWGDAKYSLTFGDPETDVRPLAQDEESIVFRRLKIR